MRTMETTKPSPQERAIAQLFDEKFEKLRQQQRHGRSYPSRDSRVDLVLYTLTDAQRFNEAASALRRELKNKRFPILVHGLSGAGKTRAILDIMANEHESQNWRFGIYLDFANLEDGMPEKNYIQHDVQIVGSLIKSHTDWLEERKANPTTAQHYLRCLILARLVLLYDLKLAGWKQSDCLYAQLGTGSGAHILSDLSGKLFVELVELSFTKVILWFNAVQHSLLVVIDEAHVAMVDSLGSYAASATKGLGSRAFISPCYGVLSNTSCVLAGTKMGLGNLRSHVISQDFQRNNLNVHPFNSFTGLDVDKMKGLGKDFFGLTDDDFATASLDILTGRCRFFMHAVNTWLESEGCTLDDAIATVIQESQDSPTNGPFHSVDAFVDKYAGNKNIVDFVSAELLTSFLKGEDSTMVYTSKNEDLDEMETAIRNVVDSSSAPTSTHTYCVALKEPLVAFALIRSLASRSIWNPVDTVLKNLNLFVNRDNVVTMGFIFEYVVAYLIIPNFRAVVAHLKQKEKYKDIPDWMLNLERAHTLHFRVVKSHVADFSQVPQQETVCFPPSRPSGPDFLAWLKAGIESYRLAVQCKLYKNPLTDALTRGAAATLRMGKGVKILFTGTGASGIPAVRVAGESVILAIPLNDLADCAEVSELGAAYMAKYGCDWNENLDDFTTKRPTEPDNEADDAMEDE